MNMDETEGMQDNLALVPLTEALPELRAADYADVRTWHDARMDLEGRYDAADGEYLKRIRDTLTSGNNLGSGLWTGYLSYCRLPERTARFRIQQAEGRYIRQAPATVAAGSLPEPANDAEEPPVVEEEPAPEVPRHQGGAEEEQEDEEPDEVEDYSAHTAYSTVAVYLSIMMDHVAESLSSMSSASRAAPLSTSNRAAFLEMVDRYTWDRLVAAVRQFDELEVETVLAYVRRYGEGKQLKTERDQGALRSMRVKAAYAEAVDLVGGDPDKVSAAQWLLVEAEAYPKAAEHLRRFKAGEESLAQAVRLVRGKTAQSPPAERG